MKPLLYPAAVCLTTAVLANAQMGRTSDWWTYAGDSQRSGWEKSEQRFTKDDVKQFQFLWEMKLNNGTTAPRALSEPLVWGNLIGSRGFKELVFVQSSRGDVWSIDADLARMYWEQHPQSARDGACSSYATVPNLPAPVVFRFRRTTPETPAAAAQPKVATAPSGATPSTPPGAPPREPPAPPPSATNAAFRVRPVYSVGNDGRLYAFNLDDGSQMYPPADFVPATHKAMSLNIAESTLYASAGTCKGGKDQTILSVTPGTAPAKASFETHAAAIPSIANPAIGSTGVVYVQTGKGAFKPDAGRYGDALVALTPQKLEVKDYFAVRSEAAPVLFTYKTRELAAVAGADGRIYLLDANSLGGSDHKTPLFRSEPMPRLWGGLRTWEETNGTRYLLATVWGKHGDNPNGSIVAMKIQDTGGSLSLVPAWTSPDLLSPDPPVIAQGVVFVLANGKYRYKMRLDPSSHATLYALDGSTGQTLWSTGDRVKQPGSLSGLTVANSRLYFTTVDNTLHVFGKYLEIEQH